MSAKKSLRSKSDNILLGTSAAVFMGFVMVLIGPDSWFDFGKSEPDGEGYKISREGPNLFKIESNGTQSLIDGITDLSANACPEGIQIRDIEVVHSSSALVSIDNDQCLDPWLSKER